MNYGLPYMGSKSKIVKHIVPLFPSADNFVDLFAGGGAVTHYAMTTAKYKHFVFNDINPLMPKAFKMALNGEFENEKRWISREEFFRLRDTDPYVAICFSFGNNLSNYMYSKDIGPVKEAYHYALFFGDYSLARERMGIDLTPLEKCPTIKEKYAMLKRIVKTTTPQFRGNKVAVNGKSRADLQSMESLQRCCGNSRVQRQCGGAYYPHPHTYTISPKMQNGESDVAKCKEMGSKQLSLSDVIEFHSTDYQAVPIPENSVIYCDIPYKGTGTYQCHKKTEFDYDRFYDWAYKQTQSIFISEYWMPEDRFRCIAEIKRTDTFSPNNKSTQVAEKIYVPKHQQTKIPKQLKLF